MQLLLRLQRGDEAVKAVVGDVFRDGVPDGPATLESNLASYQAEGQFWTDLGLHASAAATYAGMDDLARSPDGVRELLCRVSFSYAMTRNHLQRKLIGGNRSRPTGLSVGIPIVLRAASVSMVF
jgi:hypothetical protein